MSLTPTQNEALERVGRALADATRRRLLGELLDGPAYPARLAHLLGTGRANVSNHLARLRACGLVRGTVEGRQTRYELADARLAPALRDLLQIAAEADSSHTAMEDIGVEDTALEDTAMEDTGAEGMGQDAGSALPASAALPPEAALWRLGGHRPEAVAER